MRPDLSQNAPIAEKLVPLFLALTFLGGALNLVLVILSLLARNNIRRLPVFINFCAVFILWAMGSSLLAFTGYSSSLEPPFAVCVVQSAAMYGSVIMLATSYLVLQISFWLIIRSSLSGPPAKPNPNQSKIQLLLIAIPYISYFLLFFPRLAEGLRNPSLLSRAPHSFYCTINDNDVFGNTMRVVSSILGAIGLIFEGLTIRLLRCSIECTFTSSMLKSVLIRVTILTVWVAICVAIAMVETIKPTGSFWIVLDLVVASVPVVNGLLFITQADYRRVFFFSCLTSGNLEPVSPAVVEKTGVTITTVDL